MSETPSHGSNIQETPEWWMASDQRWYPPELHPDYQKPMAPAPPPVPVAPFAAEVDAGPSLADRLRMEADRVGDEAAAAAAAAVPPRLDPDATRSTMPPMGTPPGPPSGPPVVPPQHTVIQTAGQPAVAAVAPVGLPPTPAGPPASPLPPTLGGPTAPPLPPTLAGPPASPLPPTLGGPTAPPLPPTLGSVPPSPGAPPLPPTLGAPAVAPAPYVVQGPEGITYTAPVEAPPPSYPTTSVQPAQQPYPYQQPAAAPPAAAKVSSNAAGFMSIIAGGAAVAGSLLQWGKGTIEGAGGLQKAAIEVTGFDSNGLLTVICGGALILIGLLCFMGVPKQLYWAIGAVIGGGIIVGAVVFSLIDIADLSNRYAAEWQANGLASAGDIIKTQADIGLYAAGAGGVLGVLAAPFVNRS